MSHKEEPARLRLHIDAGQEADDERLDYLTRQLRNEIQELEIESVELMSGGLTPEGTKSGEAIALGELAVTVLPAVIPPLIGFLQAWLLRDKSRSVKIETQVGGRSLKLEYDPGTMTTEKLKELTDTLVASLADQRGN